MSAFNFAYYREHGGPGRGPFSEPPFYVFKGMRDRDWLAQQPQHYFLAEHWTQPVHSKMPLPRAVAPRVASAFVFDMAPPRGGWKGLGRVRVEATEDLEESAWRATLNGVGLDETSDRSEPYEDPFPSLLGRPNAYRAWIVPAATLKEGANVLRVELRTGGKSYVVQYVDLAIG